MTHHDPSRSRYDDDSNGGGRLYLINGMDNGLEDGMDYGLEDGIYSGLEDGTCNETVTSPLPSDVELLSYSKQRPPAICAQSHDLTTASSLRCWQVLHLVASPIMLNSDSCFS